MTNSTVENLTLKVSRFIKAPRERVFEAWTSPGDMSQWFKCGESKVLDATVDLRVGGKYHVRSMGDHGEIEMKGEYREVKRPERLVFTWIAGPCVPELKGTQTLVTVELTEQNGGTLLQLTHEGFTDGESRDRHNQGWAGCIDNLEKLV